MKKILILLVAVFSIGILTAQTFDETQARINKEICQLQTTLDGVKDRIYYLETTLGEKLVGDSLRHKELKDLRKERRFAAEDLVSLKSQKKMIEESLIKLKETILSASEYRIKTDAKSNLPEEMGQLEYKRRTRAQMFKSSEDDLNGGTSLKVYPGLLINYKIGLNELATFVITRVGFPEFPAIPKTLNPKERLEVMLPVGTYRVDISCGNFRGFIICNVDPRIIKHCDEQDTYWYACKLMSDF